MPNRQRNEEPWKFMEKNSRKGIFMSLNQDLFWTKNTLYFQEQAYHCCYYD